MKRSINTLVSLVLLVSYLHLGVVGHFVRWTAKGGWGQNGQHVTRSKPPQQPKVYWTQDNHLAPVVKTTVPAPAVLPTPIPTFSEFEVCGVVEVATPQIRSASTPSSPARAPPTSNAVL